MNNEKIAQVWEKQAGAWIIVAIARGFATTREAETWAGSQGTLMVDERGKRDYFAPVVALRGL